MLTSRVNERIFMNYFKIASILFVITFLVETSHASQVALTHAKQVEPIEFDIDDNLFVIHPDAIHIYNKYEVFLAPVESQREDIIRNSGFDKIGTIYDKNHSDKKLTGEAYKEALATMKDSYWLNKIFDKDFILSFKEIVQSNNIDINNLKAHTPFHESCMHRAIQKKNPDMLKILIELGIDVNKPYNGQIPLQETILYASREIVQLLLLAGANIRANTEQQPVTAASIAISMTPMHALVSEIYLAREVEQMKLMHKKFLSKGANVEELAEEIIEYLLGKNHKVMSMSECRKALQNQ